MNLSPTHLLIVLLIVILLFGSKRLPELGRSLGEGIKEFKKSAKGIMDDDDKEEKSES